MKQPIGLGTAAIGRPQYINIKEQQEEIPFDLSSFKENEKAVLEAAYQKGIRYFDTAPGYGLAEQLVTDWVLEKEDKTIEVATKWGYTYVADFDKNAKVHEVKEHSISKLNEQWLTSQKMLPYLSTYQIHSATFESGVLGNELVLERLADLKSKFNLVLGLTTSGANQTEVLQKAMAIEADGKPLFHAYQVTYNVFDQSLSTVYEKLRKQGVRIIIKEALANGRIFPNKRYPHYQMAYQTLQNLAKKYTVGIDAIALRFCVDSLSPFKVLSGAAQEQHLIDNLKTNDFKLSEAELLSLKGLQVQPKSYWQERETLVWN